MDFRNKPQRVVVESGSIGYSEQCLFSSRSGLVQQVLQMGRLRRPLSRRVCRAWHLTREVKVLLPGIRRAEG